VGAPGLGRRNKDESKKQRKAKPERKNAPELQTLDRYSIRHDFHTLHH